MNESTMTGKAAELLERIKYLIETVNRRTKAECRKAIETIASGKFDLSAEDATVLRTVYALPGKVPLKRVVKGLAAIKDEPVHSSTVSAIMTRLKKHGLLSEEDNENDMRQPLNYLTSQGEELARRL